MKIKGLFMLLLPVLISATLYGQTNLSGTISNDSILTLSKSPFNLTGSLTIRNNATLTIENGCIVNMGNYNIFAGSSSLGIINASNVTFSTTSSSEKYLDFKDGGKGNLANCSFNKVFIRVEDDAGETLRFTGNNFSNVTLPFKISPNTSPVISGNSSTSELIGLQGYAKQTKTLPKYQWPYELSGTVNIQTNAILTIDENVTIDLKNNLFSVGYTSAGILNATNVTFTSSYKLGSGLIFKDGSDGNITNCTFNNVMVTLESDAGNNISITKNNFTNIVYPIELDVNKAPVISGNISPVEKICLKGTVADNLSLELYEWEYILGSNIYINKTKTLTIDNGINIDLFKYFISVGNTSAGSIELSNSTLTSSYSNGDYIYFRDGGSGTISNCTFNNAWIKVEDDAGEDISITNNQFSNVNFPVELSANKAPSISGNSSTTNLIGLFGNVTSDNTLPKYQWDYQLKSIVYIKSNSTLTLDDGVKIDLGTNYINVGSGSSSTGYLNATDAYFTGEPGNRGRLFFNINSGGILNHCFFERTYIKIDNCSPDIQNSRFYHCGIAIEVKNGANPTINSNDFYNNELSIKHSGTIQLNATNNYWGHQTGPQHEENPNGLGELIEGDINYTPFKTTPNTGTVNGIISSNEFELGIVSTGYRIDTTFAISNEGDLDFLITKIQNNTSNISVKSLDRFWLYPDSSEVIKFSFTSLDDGLQFDTITLLTNNTINSEQNISVSALGNIDSLQINFNKINIDSFPSVKCYFTITDQANIPLPDIIKSYITLKEDGNIIPNFEFITKLDVASPVAAALVIDKSSSMQGQPLRDAKNAATDFVNELAPNDIASVISFSERVTINEPFTSNKTELIHSITSLQPMGNTAIFDAIARAIDSLQYKPGNRAVIALTDGQDNSSRVTPDIIVAMALQYGISVYTIGLGEEAEESTIKYISSSTGGEYYYAPSSEVLSIIYRRISGQLQNQYLITYNAPLNNPFPRTLELKINYHGLFVTDSIKYTNQKQKIDFISGLPSFNLGEFNKNSRSYFYYQVAQQGENILGVGEEIVFIKKYGTTYIPFGGKYMGDGIFQFWVDLVKDLNRTHLEISLPDSIIHNGSYITFENKPAPFDIQLHNFPVSESIDVFAGGSLGGRLIAGGVGAGPSIAAAAVSVKGTAGMGLNFKQNSDGDEYITRRFEAGIGEKVESPAINSVAGEVQVGAQLNMMVKGTLGQTMLFPNNMDDDAIKAKTLFLIETFSLGALSLSPDCSILKMALKESLSLLDGGMMDAYNDHYYSSLYGLNIEGGASLGASIASGSGSEQNKFKIAEVGGKMTFSGQFINYPQTSNKSINFGYALDMGFSVFSLDVMGVDLGMVAGYTAGTKISLGANFSPQNNFESFDLSMGLNQTNQIIFGQKYKSREIGFNVPKKVITRALSSQNIISSVAPFFSPTAPKLDFQIGKDYFLNSIDNMFTYATGPLDSVDDHIVIEVSNVEKNCVEINASVKIDAALVLGGGLDLGITLSYADETSSLGEQATIVDGKLLPLAHYNSPGTIDLFSIKEEVEFLLDHAPKLILDLINALITDIIETIEAGVDFVIETGDGAFTFLGNMASNGESGIKKGFGVVSSYFSALSYVNNIKSNYLDPKIINGYMSNRVICPSRQKSVADEPGTSTLYVVSNCYKINIYNDSGAVVPVFDPSLLTIAISQNKMEEYGFGEEEKSMANIFYYDFASLNWIEISGDLNEHPDTVSAMVNQSGTYAVGILYNPNRDKNAPDILNHYPVNDGIFDPDSILWAELYEPPLGVGIDLAKSTLAIDGNEVDAMWNPVKNIIFYKPLKALSLGTHTLKITATDYNSNQTIKEISFTVNKLTENVVLTNKKLNFLCYPNPMNESLSIELNHCQNSHYNISIFNSLGQRIKILFEGKVVDSGIKLSWDRMNDNGQLFPSGIYFIRVKMEDKIEVRKILVQ